MEELTLYGTRLQKVSCSILHEVCSSVVSWVDVHFSIYVKLSLK